jgi:hypothetical protein
MIVAAGQGDGFLKLKRANETCPMRKTQKIALCHLKDFIFFFTTVGSLAASITTLCEN